MAVKGDRMDQKPVIQYVGQFYVYGSEAKAPEKKLERVKSLLPKPKLDKERKIYVDPVAMCGIAVAVIMLVVLAVGAVNLERSWKEYNAISNYLSEIKRENAQLDHSYRTTFDLETIAQEAEALGLVPMDEIPRYSVSVTVPQPKRENSAWEDFVWFITGLVDKP